MVAPSGHNTPANDAAENQDPLILPKPGTYSDSRIGSSDTSFSIRKFTDGRESELIHPEISTYDRSKRTIGEKGVPLKFQVHTRVHSEQGGLAKRFSSVHNFQFSIFEGPVGSREVSADKVFHLRFLNEDVDVEESLEKIAAMHQKIVEALRGESCTLNLSSDESQEELQPIMDVIYDAAYQEFGVVMFPYVPDNLLHDQTSEDSINVLFLSGAMEPRVVPYSPIDGNLFMYPDPVDTAWINGDRSKPPIPSPWFIEHEELERAVKELSDGPASGKTIYVNFHKIRGQFSAGEDHVDIWHRRAFRFVESLIKCHGTQQVVLVSTMAFHGGEPVQSHLSDLFFKEGGRQIAVIPQANERPELAVCGTESVDFAIAELTATLQMGDPAPKGRFWTEPLRFLKSLGAKFFERAH